MNNSALIISVPSLEVHRPPISTAIIANCIKKADFLCDAIDLNIKFFHYVGKDEYYNYDNIFENIERISFSKFKKIVKFLQIYYPLSQHYDIVGISVFGLNSHIFTKILCLYIRKHSPSVKIVLGGAGVLTTFIQEINSDVYYGQMMLDEMLCDYYISGEGEISIVELLKGHYEYPGINSNHNIQISNINELPIPDYSYYNLAEYDYLEARKEVFILGSRGCVRKCTYCTIPFQWPKFRFRSAENISQEIIHHHEEYGITSFHFADSLINGSQTVFLKMCEILSKYNNTTKHPIKWGGQFIFKQKKHISDEYFDMIASAGGSHLTVGIETGSDKIRWEMNKKFTNDDIQYHLEHFNRVNISVIFLLLSGYVSETLADHAETIAMFKNLQYYVASGTITGIELGSPLILLPNTPLDDMKDDYGIYYIDPPNRTNNQLFWESTKNPQLTILERIRRRVEIQKAAIKYNWPIWRGEQRLETLKIMLNDYVSTMSIDKYN